MTPYGGITIVFAVPTSALFLSYRRKVTFATLAFGFAAPTFVRNRAARLQLDDHALGLRGRRVDACDELAERAVGRDGVDVLRGHEIVVGLETDRAESAAVKERGDDVVVDDLLALENRDRRERLNRGVVDVADRQVLRLDLDVLRRRRIEDAGVGAEGAAGRRAADAEPDFFRRGGGGDEKKSGKCEKAQTHDESSVAIEDSTW